MTQDEDHLKLLSAFHYVVGGLAGLFACFPIIHLIVGLFFVFAPEKLNTNGPAPPALFGWMFVIFAAAFIAMGWTFAAFVLAAGRSLAKRKRYMFCLVMAGVECIFMPLGTVLGVFTIIILLRPSVKQLFGVISPNCTPDVPVSGAGSR